MTQAIEAITMVLDPAFFEGFSSGFVSNYIVDDDDTAGSSLHAVLFVSNITGMIPGVDTGNSDAVFCSVVEKVSSILGRVVLIVEEKNG